MQTVNIERFLPAHQPHIHQQKWNARGMVGMKMSDDDIREIVEVQSRLFQTQDRIADRVDQQHAITPYNDHVCVLALRSRDGIGGTENNYFGHKSILTQFPAVEPLN